jgi:hypothetical protein
MKMALDVKGALLSYQQKSILKADDRAHIKRWLAVAGDPVWQKIVTEFSISNRRNLPRLEAAMSPWYRDPASLLSRIAVADALTESGYPIKAKTLATMATRGGGPPYRLWSKVALYNWGDALQWAQGRLSNPQHNTSARDIGEQSVTDYKSPKAASAARHLTRSGRP